MGLINKKDLFDLLSERNKLLREHPELKELQEEFNKVMKKMGKNKNNRCVMAQELMLKHFDKVTRALDGLKLDMEELAAGCKHETRKPILCKDGGSKRHTREDGL